MVDEDEIWEKPASVPSPPWRWRTRTFAGLIVLSVIGVVAFVAMGMLRTSSLDVPLPHNIRLGFFGNTAPVRWRCSDGHDHWSMPYWSGAVALAAIALIFGRLFARSR